jgi:hypothetical protein
LAPPAARAQDAPPPALDRAPPVEAPPPSAAPGAPEASAEPAEPAAPAELTPASRYRSGKNHFEYGDCAAAIEVLKPLAVPGRLQDERQQLEVHRMLGVCYVLTSRPDDAERELSSLVNIDPDYSLDPFLTPPAAIDIFEREKSRRAAQLEEIRRARDEARRSGLDGTGVIVEQTTTVKEVPLAAAFMPFGLAQGANGENVKAVVIGGTQALFLAANIVLFWTSIGMLLSEDDIGEAIGPPDRKAAYQGVVFAHLLAAVGFAGAYGYGVADALWNREDGAVVEVKRSRRPMTPADVRELKKIPAAPARD